MIKPGSRPKGGPKLPAVGDKTSPGKENTDPSVRQPQQNTGDVSGSSTKTDGKTKVVTKYGGNPHYKVAPAAFIQPHTEQNPLGVSVNFTAPLFQKEVNQSLDPWFIKFYAPWCPHCQHMAPAWAAMAQEMKGKLNVGEVNCDIERKLCKENGIRSFPTMKLLRGPEKIEYDGLRGVGDLVDFGNRISENLKGIDDITMKEFDELQKTEEVIFLYFYDVATAAEDFQALERLPLHMNGKAKLVKTQDPDLVSKFRISTWPRLVVSRDGQTEVYPGLSPGHMRDVPKLVKWIKQNWLPIVPEVTASNAREIFDDKYVVLGILTRDRAHDFETAKKEIKNSAIEWMDRSRHAFELERQELRDAKQLRVDEAQNRDDERALRDAKLIKIDIDAVKRKGVAFAWIDGIFWERWLKTTFGVSVADGEKVIIYDDDNHHYWDATVTGNPIIPSRTSILETLPKVVSSPSRLRPKATGSFVGHMFFKMRKHPIASLVILLVGGIGLWIVGRIVRRRRRGGSGSGFPKIGEKEGLLGMTQTGLNGKAD